MKIDGKKITTEILNGLRKRVEELKRKGIVPTLAIFVVGDDPASLTYVRQKELKAQSIGVQTIIKYFTTETSEKKLLKIIEQFNKNNNIHGIIAQIPLPKNIDEEKIIKAIDPKKDVDGFLENSRFKMPISAAILEILKEVYFAKRKAGGTGGKPVTGPALRNWLKLKNIVVIGKGETGGKPIIEMFKKMNIKPTIIDSKTKNPKALTKKADIIISAVGKPNVIDSQNIKRGVILIGIGLFRGADGKLHGDFNEEAVKNIVSFYTSTPGGVGPVNVAMLLKNLIDAIYSSITY